MTGPEKKEKIILRTNKSVQLFFTCFVFLPWISKLLQSSCFCLFVFVITCHRFNYQRYQHILQMHRGFNEGGRLSMSHIAYYQRESLHHHSILPWLLLLIQYVGKCAPCGCATLGKLFINCVFPMIHFIVMIYIQGLFSVLEESDYRLLKEGRGHLLFLYAQLADWRPSRQCLRSKWLCALPTPYLHPACVCRQLYFAESGLFCNTG